MTLLLDTHVFIWMIESPEKLPAQVKNLLQDRNNLILLSSASIYEMAIKTRLGKLKCEGDFKTFIMDQVKSHILEILDITSSHTI